MGYWFQACSPWEKQLKKLLVLAGGCWWPSSQHGVGKRAGAATVPSQAVAGMSQCLGLRGRGTGTACPWLHDCHSNVVADVIII